MKRFIACIIGAFTIALAVAVLTPPVSTVDAQVSNPVIIPAAPPGSCTSGLPLWSVYSTGTLYICNNGTPTAIGGGTGTVTSISTTAPITGGTITTTGTIACATCVVTIAHGATALNTAAVGSGACETVVTATATGTLTTDVITVGFNTDPTAITGYGKSATGAVLTIYPYPTADTVNLAVCNSTSGSITPSALTLNWRVER